MAESGQVLVVDDDPGVCKLTQMTLKERGYQVTICPNATRALELLKAAPYKCVLLDIRMEEIDGTELLPIIKHNFPTLPVIVVSAYCDKSESGYFNSLGAFEVVAKPFSGDRLLDVVNRAVGATETVPFVLTSLNLGKARNQVYRKLIITALRRANWNQVKAAELLGVSRYCLIRWLRKLDISY